LAARRQKERAMLDATVSSHHFSYSLLDGCAIVRPEGACNEERTEALARFVNSPLIGAKNLILDLSHAGYVESPGYRWLVRQVRTLESDGRRLVLAGVPESVDRALKLLKLESVVPTARNVKEALAKVNGHPKRAVV
jgi:anti-anti-sigma factor